jgi:hypothetical protein
MEIPSPEAMEKYETGFLTGESLNCLPMAY